MRSPSERITAISIAITTAFGSAEVAAGLLFGTIAFLAAGIDALFDTLTSMLVLAGLRVSVRPPDRDHQYGHRQAETLVSVALAAALVVAAVRIAWMSVERLISPTRIELTVPLIILAAVSIAVLGVLAWQKIRIGRTSGNRSVLADGYHTLTDTISSLSVLVGMGFVALGVPQADPAVGLVISGMIGYWGLRIGKESVDVLMGASPGKEVVSEMRRASMEVKGVESCHRVRARRVGSRILGDIHVQVKPHMSVRRSHEIATRVERKLRSRIPNLSGVLVHVEPAEVRRAVKKSRRGKG